MTKLIKNLIIGGSTTAVVAGGATGAGIALTNKHSDAKAPVIAHSFKAEDASKDQQQDVIKKLIAEDQHQQELIENAQKIYGGSELEKSFEQAKADANSQPVDQAQLAALLAAMQNF